MTDDHNANINTYLECSKVSDVPYARWWKLPTVCLVAYDSVCNYYASLATVPQNGSWLYCTISCLLHVPACAQIDLDGLNVTAEYQDVTPTVSSDISPPIITAIGGYYTKIAVRSSGR